MDENTKFTMESSSKEIPFFDIVIYIENTEINTDIYHKDTYTFIYLDFRSSHPRHCTSLHIPFNMARRLCTIVLDHIIKEQRLDELKTRLWKRNTRMVLLPKE